MFDFSDQVVLVTGGTGNLGSAVVSAYVEAGARLAAPERKSGRIREMFSHLTKSQDHYLPEMIDVTDPESVDSLIRGTLDHLGRIDILVHTVGGYRAEGPPHQTSLETWDFMQSLNARSTFLVNRGVIPAMLEQGHGCIVNVASRSALKSGSEDVAYAAAKSVVARITESMASAYKQQGIRTNAVIPGTIDTPENREAMPEANSSLWVAPEQIAQVILFLTSDLAKEITGALVPVYGS